LALRWSPAPAVVAANAPDADVKDGLAVDEAVVEGVHQTHGVLLQDHHQVLALQSVKGSLSLADGLGIPSTQPMYRDTPIPPAYSAPSVGTAPCPPTGLASYHSHA